MKNNELWAILIYGLLPILLVFLELYLILKTLAYFVYDMIYEDKTLPLTLYTLAVIINWKIINYLLKKNNEL